MFVGQTLHLKLDLDLNLDIKNIRLRLLKNKDKYSTLLRKTVNYRRKFFIVQGPGLMVESTLKQYLE